MALTVDDFDFPLPPELIAQHPAPERTGSRLLHVCGRQQSDRKFADLPGLLRAGDLLVFNDTRVMKARLFGQKESGGRVEVMLERIIDARHAIAQIRASKSPRPGTRILLADAFTVRVTGRAGASGEFFTLELVDRGNLWELAEQHGKLPLPPYIAHPAGDADETRYQTVYAREPGAVAAPTAGLHLTRAVLDAIAARGGTIATVTLHVGLGTFAPIRVDELAAHAMHVERYDVPAATAALIASGRPVVAIGTTVVRTLESAATGPRQVAVGPGATSLFIRPGVGYRFQIVDALVTNFHLPESTLLMLVAAFAGYDRVMAAYRHAVAAGYRFFSYGDAMLVRREAP